MKNKYSRRAFIGSSSATFLAGLTSPAVSAAEAQSDMPVASAKHSRPNLVLFVPDELRADALACYGNPLAKTPNYDKLAAGGTQFSNCHV